MGLQFMKGVIDVTNATFTINGGQLMANPRYTLLMHKGAGTPLFCELDADEWAFVDSTPQRYRIFIIDGAEVCVLVATEDKTMTRAEALKCASAFVLGLYERIDVDLKRLIASVSRGQPKINHPPY